MVPGIFLIALVRINMRARLPVGQEAARRVLLRMLSAGVAQQAAVKEVDGFGTLKYRFVTTTARQDIVRIQKSGTRVYADALLILQF